MIGSGGGQDRATAAGLAVGLVTGGCRDVHGTATAGAFGLVAVAGILLLMAELLFFRQSLPLVFLLYRFAPPLRTDDLGDVWVGYTGVLGDYTTLVVLSIEDEC